jgi:hypothetical protein
MELPIFPNTVIHVRLESAAPFMAGFDTMAHDPFRDRTVIIRAGRMSGWSQIGVSGGDRFANWVAKNAKDLASSLDLGAHFGTWFVYNGSWEKMR